MKLRQTLEPVKNRQTKRQI